MQSLFQSAKTVPRGEIVVVPLENEHNFWSIFNLYPQAVAVSDMKMTGFINVNDRFCELMQCAREEILSGSISDLAFYTEDDRRKFIHELNITGEINGLEKDFKLKDGSFVNTLMFSRLITNGKERYVLSIFWDVTERKQLKYQSWEEKANEIIANLVGGIAHEFNNALAGILGNMELLEMDLEDNEAIRKYGKSINASVQRMSKITNRLMAFTGKGKFQEETISLSAFIKDTLPGLKRTLDPAIVIDTDQLKDNLNVKADCSQIQMLLSDILTNAAEATEGPGQVRISVREEKIDEEFVSTHPDLKPGRYVCLAIEDDGKGMDEETKKRIFEPFFTTKSHGRGLGMAAAYGIVRNHDGGIYVDSESGKGTRVCVYLPAIEKEGKKPDEPIDEVAVCSGTILVIDDEETILAVSRTILEKLGYRVLEASSGKEAVKIAEDADLDIDLALLDLKMPDMDGTEIYPLIKKARPNLKVIVCSGLDANGPVQKILEAGAEDFIPKPFTLEALSEKIRSLIERRRDDRFKVVQGTIAIHRDDHSKLGQIIDISRGGLAFWYNDGRDLTREFAELAISLAAEGFYLDKMPCTVISCVAASRTSPLNRVNMKRVGVQLGELTRKQTDQLEIFIRNFTTDQV